MSHYRSNLRDIFFNLFEVLGRDEVLGHGPYEDMDHDTAVAVLTEIEHLATTKLASSYVDSDRHPPVYDPQTKTVALPEAFKASYATLLDSGFYNLELPAELGGQPSPPSLQWAANELNLGANPALLMYAAGPKFATVLWHNGTERDQRIAQIMIDRQWGATMVLTEPDAGSDVGAGRTRAIPQPDGSWHLEGVKRFITSGEQDMTENIVHLVLARPVGVEGAGGPGTKGLSLFIVPKLHFDHTTGELTGERNGVYATNVEKKMGIKASTTCELTFGDGTPAQGLAAGRGARRHRPDVPGDRARPDAGRHQGHRDALHRLPERPGVRQDPGAGCRSRRGRGPDRTARHDHPPPRCPPVADEPEGVRRGAPLPGPVHRERAGPRWRWPRPRAAPTRPPSG